MKEENKKIEEKEEDDLETTLREQIDLMAENSSEKGYSKCTSSFQMMKVMMRVLHLLWIMSLMSGTKGALLKGQECIDLTDDQADRCDEHCANQICIRKRFEDSESKCYQKFITTVSYTHLTLPTIYSV